MKQLLNESFIFEAMIEINTKWIADRLEKVKSQLISIANQTEHKDIVYSKEMGKILTNLFKDEKIIFKYERGPANYGIVGGFTLDNRIEIYYNEDLYVEMFEGEYWPNIRDTIVGTLHHELIHRQQIARAKINKPGISRAKIGFWQDLKRWEDYFGSPHEIMAYATSIYWEMLFAGLSHETMKKVIRQDDGQLERISEVYYEYKELFNKNHPVMKKLLKYVAGLIE